MKISQTNKCLEEISTIFERKVRFTTKTKSIKTSKPYIILIDQCFRMN